MAVPTFEPLQSALGQEYGTCSIPLSTLSSTGHLQHIRLVISLRVCVAHFVQWALEADPTGLQIPLGC